MKYPNPFSRDAERSARSHMPPAVHPEWEAFVSAIVAEPDDDTPRLVAADWLDEHGDADRAAFIRTQVELARLEALDPRSVDVDRLRAKERAFLGPLSICRGLWGAADCPQLVRMKPPERGAALVGMGFTGEDRVVFRRGFVEAVVVSATEWWHHGVAVRARNPVLRVVLQDCTRATRDQWYQMMGSGALIGLRSLILEGATGSTHEWLRGFLPGTDVEAIS